MDHNAELLFEYLRKAIYDPSNANLDVDQLDEDFVSLGKGLQFFFNSMMETSQLAKSLAQGELSVKLPSPENELASPLKALHASLKHITWQSKQVAKGDYSQHIDFMGEFADAFNTMIKQLDSRQKALEQEIEENRNKTILLEQNSKLVSTIIALIPQEIIVVKRLSDEVLYTNDAMKKEVNSNPLFLDQCMRVIKENQAALSNGGKVEFQFLRQGRQRYFSMDAYPMEWNHIHAIAYVLNDISIEKEKLLELEMYAFHDTMTKVYNRFYGMKYLEELLNRKQLFTICFLDLNNLKYVNDAFGHSKGDLFIIETVNALKNHLDDARICRLGGDEFMILSKSISYDEMYRRMQEVAEQLRQISTSLPYFYSISYGIVEVRPENKLVSSELLSLADERMYQHKRMLKTTAMAPYDK